MNGTVMLYYNLVGTNCYTQLVNAKPAEQVKHPSQNDKHNPYVDGTLQNDVILQFRNYLPAWLQEGTGPIISHITSSGYKK